MRDRESLFNEYILEVRRREKDEKIQKKETVSMSIRLKLIYAMNKYFFYLIKSRNSLVRKMINKINKIIQKFIH